MNRRGFLGTALAGAPLLSAAPAETTFDFDTPYNRLGTDSMKWDAQVRRYGKNSIVAGMGISDTDFRTAPSITKALTERVKHENWGYLEMPQSFIETIISWNKRHYGIEINPHQMLLSTGVHPSIVSALRAFSSAGSKVLVLTPTYDGFFGDISAAGCVREECPLRWADGRYHIDLAALDRQITNETKSLILCNPNNPTGNAWSAEELTALGELCTQRGVVVLVDEIHCDFMTKGQKYSPYCLLTNRAVAMNSVTFKSASKAFSLSAMKCGWMFSGNGDYIKRIAATGHSGDINTLGVVAAQAAYTGGEDYLKQLVAYIDGNHDYVEQFVRAEIPLIRYKKPQSTYLAWLDVSAARAKFDTGSPNQTPEQRLQAFLVKEAKVLINAGTNYGVNGAGRMRMNIATSRRTIELALNNIADALRKI